MCTDCTVQPPTWHIATSAEMKRVTLRTWGFNKNTKAQMCYSAKGMEKNDSVWNGIMEGRTLPEIKEKSNRR